MSDEKWFELKEKLKERFGEVRETRSEESGEDDIGQKIPSVTETLEFMSEMGELRIERVTRPKIIDKIAHYHKGAGGAQVEYVLSPDEKTHKINVYKKDDAGEWQALELPPERLSF